MSAHSEGSSGDEEDSCFMPQGVTLDPEEFRRRLVQGHNRYRSLHASPRLTRLRELEQGAQRWAEAVAATGTLLYCEQLKNIGESVFCIDLLSSDPSAERIVQEWYREIKNYSFAVPRWRRGSFHFTQMVWKSSSHIGIGIAPVPGEPKVFVVVRYFPGGNSNFPGDFQRNVLPRISPPSQSSMSSLDDSSFLRTYSRSTSITTRDVYI